MRGGACVGVAPPQPRVHGGGSKIRRVDVTGVLYGVAMATHRRFVFTSESVTSGHPDKLADQISDAVLDAALEQDPHSRMGCETLVTTGLVVVASEMTTSAYIDIPQVVRDTIIAVGYDRAEVCFDGNTCGLITAIDQQAPEIIASMRLDAGEQGQVAGDQGMVFGFACDETPELMPLPISLAHRLARRLEKVRVSETVPYLGPDGKSQATVIYEGLRPVGLDTVVVAAQHRHGISRAQIVADIKEHVVTPVIGEQFHGDDYTLKVNEAGEFTMGGPRTDCGLTGRKVVADTYGGMARHGGGAYSGKDPSKVDRTGSYAARWAAKNIVAAGAASRCEIQIAYAIGVLEPVSITVETFGTETVDPAKIETAVRDIFDLRPGIIIRDLDLLRPIYSHTSVYGHFGRTPHDVFTWERTDRTDEIRSALELS